MVDKVEELRQFKLSNGEELVAEVLDWPEAEEEWQIVAKNAMKVVCFEDPKEGFRYYTFRPWIIYSKPDTIITLAEGHIVGEAIPSSEVKDQYYKALKLEDEMQKYEKKKKLKDVKDGKKSPTEVLTEFASKVAAEYDLMELDSESKNNIITFPNKLH